MTLTIQEFRSDPERVMALRRVMAEPALIEALVTLRENGPEFRTQPTGLNPTDAAMRLGHIAGHAEFYRTLSDMTEPLREAEQPEATYEPPEENAE